MRETFKGRVNLSEKASQALLFMVQELKNENAHIQINPSKLCAWIVENYVKDHFSKDTERLIQEHFNPKRYLTEMLKQAKTGEDIKSAFQAALHQIGSKEVLTSLRRKVVRVKLTGEQAGDSKTDLPSKDGA